MGTFDDLFDDAKWAPTVDVGPEGRRAMREAPRQMSAGKEEPPAPVTLQEDTRLPVNSPGTAFQNFKASDNPYRADRIRAPGAPPSPVQSAATGAGAPTTRGVQSFDLGPALETVGATMAPSAAADPRQLRQIGYSKVAETARKYGVVGARDPAVANSSVRSGRAAVGAEIGDVFNTIGNDYARPTAGLMQSVDRATQAMRGTREGNAKADALFAEAKRIRDLHADTGSIPLRDLRAAIEKSTDPGLTRFLKGELDAGMALAGKDPRFASAVARVPELHATHEALGILDKTTGRRLGVRSVEPSPAAVAALRPGLASALARKDKDPDAVAVELANELFGRGGQ